MSSKHQWFSLTLLSITIVLVSSRLLGQGAPPESISEPLQPQHSVPCTVSEPELHVWSGQLEPSGARLRTNGFWRKHICQSGHLRFEAELSENAPAPVHLTVHWQGALLREQEITTRTSVRLTVPGPGWLSIALLHNTFPEQGGHYLWLSEIAYEESP